MQPVLGSQMRWDGHLAFAVQHHHGLVSECSLYHTYYVVVARIHTASCKPAPAVPGSNPGRNPSHFTVVFDGLDEGSGGLPGRAQPLLRRLTWMVEKTRWILRSTWWPTSMLRMTTGSAGRRLAMPVRPRGSVPG